jgi:hypothetical protein
MNVPLRRNAGLAGLALLASTGTLVCCVLPAMMVAIGAGAALAGLISAVPQLVWLSEHKSLVFGIAGLLLIIAGASLWRARRLPCPIDPLQARQCATLRRWSAALYRIALVSFAAGAVFAFVLPWWNG